MKPLEGLSVLDFSHALSGPTCTNMLALLGAEVIKIEKPKIGDDFRHYIEHAGEPGMSIPFASTNTGKKSITLDMRKPEALEVIHRLAKRSDFVVQNFRPDVPRKLGIDWDSLKVVNPALIYCSITGFGQTGQFRDWVAYDHIIQAMSGITLMTGMADAEPMKVGFPMMDTFTGYMAVIAMLASLERRRKTGEGEFIDVAMLDSAFKLMATSVSTAFYTGITPGRSGNKGYRLVATAEIYKTAEGYIALGANLQHQIDAMAQALDLDWLANDPRYANHDLRIKNYEALRADLVTYFMTQRAADLEARLAAAHVPVAMVRELGEIINHPHFEERDVMLRTTLPGTDRELRIAGAGFQLASGPLDASPPPQLGEHNEEILRDLGYDERDIRGFADSGVT